MSDPRLRWQCRRGMRELDDLLLRYLDRHFDAAGAAEKCAFETLLTLPDPELVQYLLQKHEPGDPAIATVVRRILDPDQG